MLICVTVIYLRIRIDVCLIHMLKISLRMNGNKPENFFNSEIQFRTIKFADLE